MRVNEVTVKSALTKSNLPGADFVINPYIGCQHSCLYCYADFMRRFTGHGSEKWGVFVDVRVNAAETINLSKVSSTDLILVGSVTDPYQPLESKYGITRKCLEVLLDAQPNVEILTKSPLILRDLDLLKRFRNLRVGISIGILDESYSRQLEPFVSSPKQRLDALKTLSEAGVETYLFVSPIFPEISDIYGIVDSAKDFVGEIFFENLNIRANNREGILDFVRHNRPELKTFYEGLSRNRSYWDNLEGEIGRYCRSKGIKYRTFFHHGTKS